MNNYRQGKVNVDKLFKALCDKHITMSKGFYDVKRMLQTHIYDISKDSK